MSTRGKSVDILLVDVGSAMHPHLGDTARVLSNFALAKTLNKPAHETAVLLYGSTETRNALYEECQEYEHITVLQELRTPNQETLRLLEQLPAGTGPSDVIDAFTVIVDLLIKASQERAGLQMVPKKLTVISNFAEEGKEADEGFVTSISQGFKDHHIQLQLVCMSAPDAAAKAVQEANLKMLDMLRAEAGDREVRHVQRFTDLASVFRLHEVSFQCVKSELEIGKSMKLRLRVYKKCGFEKLPSLKTKAIYGEGLADITTSVASYLAAPEAEEGQEPATAPMDVDPVPPEEQVKAYRYGKQYVPIDEVEDMFYHPGRCLQLLGFVDRKHLLADQRYLFIGDPSVLLPEQDEAAQVACSGLVQSMMEKDKAAIVRYGRTARSQVQLCALLPQLGSATIPDHFLMVVLPFSEDMRGYTFPPMAPKPEMQPSTTQYQAAVALVQAMDLTAGVSPPGVPELLKPEETPNAVLRRFYAALGKLSLAPQEQDWAGKEEQLPGLASEDQLVQEVLQTPWAHFRPGANERKAAFSQAFATQVVERTTRKQRGDQAAGDGANDADGSSVNETVTLSDEYPVEDFKAAVSAGKVQAAVAALGSRVNDLVDKSVRNRAYTKALGCCEAMRQACVDKAEAAPFNTFLQSIKDKYQQHDAHSEFWQLVRERGVTLISSTDVASSTVKPEEAEAFLQQRQEAVATVVEEKEVIDLGDDLDDME